MKHLYIPSLLQTHSDFAGLFVGKSVSFGYLGIRCACMGSFVWPMLNCFTKGLATKFRNGHNKWAAHAYRTDNT